MLDDACDVFAGAVADPEGHLEGVQRQVGGHLRHRPPADYTPGEHVRDERGERHPRPSRHIGEVDQPELVGPVRAELALDVILSPRRGVVGASGDELLAAADATQTLLTHEALDRAPGNDDALALEQSPDLADAADTAAEFTVPEHPLDLHDQFRIADGSSGGGSLLECVVNGRSDLYPVLCEHAADRLDPEPVTMVIDELNYHGSRGSSSRAKNEEAANRISFARFNSRTSASSCLILYASSVVVPGRSPASI